VGGGSASGSGLVSVGDGRSFLLPVLVDCLLHYHHTRSSLFRALILHLLTTKNGEYTPSRRTQTAVVQHRSGSPPSPREYLQDVREERTTLEDELRLGVRPASKHR